jgi:hypothetical protein
MLNKGQKVFLRIPRDEVPPRRVLHPAVVVSLEDDGCLLQLDEPRPGIEVSMSAILHFEERRNFLQQAAIVVRKDSEEPLVLGVQLQGSPVSAESRQCFRVSCLGADIRAKIADEAGCEVVDLSATGFAFYGRRTYELGKQVLVSMVYATREYSGRGTIQSARTMTPKLTRYGIHCTDIGKDDLARSLASINLAVQGEQQRRMSAKAASGPR